MNDELIARGEEICEFLTLEGYNCDFTIYNGEIVLMVDKFILKHTRDEVDGDRIMHMWEPVRIVHKSLPSWELQTGPIKFRSYC